MVNYHCERCGRVLDDDAKYICTVVSKTRMTLHVRCESACWRCEREHRAAKMPDYVAEAK